MKIFLIRSSFLVPGLIAICIATFAQQIYGVLPNGGLDGAGTIYRSNIDGTGFTKTYDFPAPPGSRPLAVQLTEGPGHKLYGVTAGGGTYNSGVLFEFDYVTKVYRALYNMGPVSSVTGKVMLASDGNLYGTGYGFQNSTIIFQYNLTLQQYSEVHQFTFPKGNLSEGKLLEYNGKLYGLGNSQDPNYPGSIYTYDLATNEVEIVAELKLEDPIGFRPRGGLALAPNGKMYGITTSGSGDSRGTLFEFDPATEEVVVRKTLNSIGISGASGTLLLGSNGKFYCSSSGGGFGNGMIYSYDYVNDILTKSADMPFFGPWNPTGTLTEGPDGKFYGLSQRTSSSEGDAMPFIFDPTTNNVTYGLGCVGSLNHPMTASNGKIYFTDVCGDGRIEEWIPGGFNISTVYNFESKPEGGHSIGGLTQAHNGLLYGTTPEGGNGNSLGTIFSIDPANGQHTKLIDLDWDSDEIQLSKPIGSFVLHPNGLMYVVAAFAKGGPGGVIEFDPSTNTIKRQFRFLYQCNIGAPSANLTVTPDGRLFGVTAKGGSNFTGAIYEIDLIAGQAVKRLDFVGPNGKTPIGELVWLNGKLYGFTDSSSFFQYGLIYEYDPVTNQLTIRHKFGTTAEGRAPDKSPIIGTDGLLYGRSLSGVQVFTFNTSNDEILFRDVSNINTLSSNMVLGPDGAFYGTSLSPSTGILRWDPTSTAASYLHLLTQDDGISGSYPPTSLNIPTFIKPTQSINLSSAPISKTYGDADFSPGATASSSMPVIYTSNNPSVATIVNGKVHITGAGTATISAYQQGNASFLVAQSKAVSLNVAKRDLDVTPRNVTRMYGESIGSYEIDYIGFVGTDNRLTLDNMPGAIEQANLLSSPGFYNIIIDPNTGGDHRYNVKKHLGQLTITKAPLKVSVDDYERDYKQNNPEFIAKYDGFRNFETAASLNSPAVPVSAADKDSKPADYPITFTPAVTPNYEVTYVNGTLTIHKIGQEIQFDAPGDKTTGDNSFDLVALSTSELPITFTSSDETIATIGGNTVTIKKGGTITITASQEGDDNYFAADDVSQDVVITTAIETVTGLVNFNEAITLSPSPVESRITIQFPGTQAEVKIFDLTGRMVHNETIRRENAVSVSSLASGTYLLSIETNDVRAVRRFVKK
jgi:uncharacterized repeat protein (TIGR03803 family)